MAPLITIGAVILLWRKAATKVIVSHLPSGTAPITRTPRGARPLSLTMFVLTAVSSINTSRAGSSIPCSRIQRRRPRATSARCRSAACSTFFERDVVSVEKTPERAAAGFDPSLAQFCNRFYQGQVRPLGDQIQNLDRELFQRRNAPAARLRGGAPLLIPALQPLYRRRHADLETLCCLASRRTGLHSGDNALPQVTRIGLRHPSPHKRRINAQRLPHSEPAGNPTDSNKPGTALDRYSGCKGDFVLVWRLCHATLRPTARTRASRSSTTR